MRPWIPIYKWFDTTYCKSPIIFTKIIYSMDLKLFMVLVVGVLISTTNCGSGEVMSKRSMDIDMGDDTGTTLEGLANKVPINEINTNKVSNNVQQSSQMPNYGFQQLPFDQQSSGGGGGGGGGGEGGGGGGGGGKKWWPWYANGIYTIINGKHLVKPLQL